MKTNSSFTHIKDINVRGQDNPNGTGQWIKVGQLYQDDEGKQFISFNAIALSPSLLMQVQTMDRNIPMNLFDPADSKFQQKREQTKKPDSKPYKRKEGKQSFDDMKDDVPF